MRKMRQTTFILGAGFSVAAGFPLVRGLRELVVNFMQNDRHPVYAPFLQAGQGFKDGQFAEGVNRVDPELRLGFEELLIELQNACANAVPDDPCHTTLRVLRIGCARLLWQRQNAMQRVPLQPLHDIAEFRNCVGQGHTSIWKGIPKSILFGTQFEDAFLNIHPDHVDLGVFFFVQPFEPIPDLALLLILGEPSQQWNLLIWSSKGAANDVHGYAVTAGLSLGMACATVR